MQKFVLCATLIAVSCLVATAAMTGGCQPINVRIGPSTYLDPCTYDGTDYLFCIDAPIRGTLNGIWQTIAKKAFSTTTATSATT